MISIGDQIACIKREIALRKNIYPRWVENGRMKQAAADLEIERMTAALHTLLNVKGEQDALEAEFAGITK